MSQKPRSCNNQGTAASTVTNQTAVTNDSKGRSSGRRSSKRCILSPESRIAETAISAITRRCRKDRTRKNGRRPAQRDRNSGRRKKRRRAAQRRFRSAAMAKGLEYLLNYPSERQDRRGGAVFGKKGNAALEFVIHGRGLSFSES